MKPQDVLLYSFALILGYFAGDIVGLIPVIEILTVIGLVILFDAVMLLMFAWYRGDKNETTE